MRDEILSEREKEVLRLLSMGRNNPQIADELVVSRHTAKAHVSSILHKINAKDRTQAVVKAIKLGLIDI